MLPELVLRDDAVGLSGAPPSSYRGLVPKKPLRERKKQQTRHQLMRSVVELFDLLTYDGTTVDNIADAANCSRSTFFRYFGAKEDVLFGDLPERLARFKETIEAAPADSDPWEVAELALKENVEAFLSGGDPELERQCIALWFKEPALQRRYIEIILAWETTLADYLARVRGVDVADDIVGKTVASAMVGVGRAVTEMQLLHADDLERAMEAGLATLRHGYAQLRTDSNAPPEVRRSPRPRARLARG